MRYVLLIVLALFAVSAEAQTMMIIPGLVCDTEAQVTELIDSDFAVTVGCGNINEIHTVEIEPIGERIYGDYKLTIVKLTFAHPSNFDKVQYGYQSEKLPDSI